MPPMKRNRPLTSWQSAAFRGRWDHPIARAHQWRQFRTSPAQVGLPFCRLLPISASRQQAAHAARKCTPEIFKAVEIAPPRLPHESFLCTLRPCSIPLCPAKQQRRHMEGMFGGEMPVPPAVQSDAPAGGANDCRRVMMLEGGPMTLPNRTTRLVERLGSTQFAHANRGCRWGKALFCPAASPARLDESIGWAASVRPESV
jgi:hypothetical protein